MSTEDAIIRCPICSETSPQGYLLCPFCGADLTVAYEEKFYPPVTYKEFWFRFKRLIVQPRAISQEIADNPDQKAAFLFSLVIGFSLALQVLAYILHTRTLDGKFYLVVFLLSWIITFVLPILIWLLSSWTIRSMTKLLGGKASKKQIRAAVGYGYLPIVFAELLIAILYLIALPYGNIPGNDIGQVIDSMIALRNSFIGITGIVIHFAGILVSGVYIVFITKPACDFSWIETAISVSIPLIVFMILMITYYVGTSPSVVT